MAFVILGLLHLRAMSMYDILKAFDQGISLFYSASAGSIKRALDGLLTKGHITVAENAPGPRGRKTYAVTEAGRAAFREWMHGPLTDSDLDAAVLPRLYLLGLVPAPERTGILTAMRERAARDLAALESMAVTVDGQEAPDELSDVARYARATLDYGLTSYRGGLEWFDTFLETER